MKRVIGKDQTKFPKDKLPYLMFIEEVGDHYLVFISLQPTGRPVNMGSAVHAVSKVEWCVEDDEEDSVDDLL